MLTVNRDYDNIINEESYNRLRTLYERAEIL